jgi:two-component system phosphate regulon response regulator PhoB
VRSVVYRFPELDAFERAVSEAHDSALLLPDGEVVDDGEWVLAIFELGPGRRATSAAGLGETSPDGSGLVFERRDLESLVAFARDTRARTRESVRGAPRDTKEPSRILPAQTLPRVLVVDDDPDIRDVVSTMLEAVGLAVLAVESGEDALDRLAGPAREPFDLVVLDWNLPQMTGLELCRALRNKPGPAKDIPILFLTAHDASQDMVDAFASGADDYVVKPFRAPELGARIFSLIRRARRAAG